MATDYSRKLLFSPADLGFDNVSVAPASTTVNGKWISWRRLLDFRAISFIMEVDTGLAGATPWVLGLAVRDFDNAAWINSEVNINLIASITNNPRTEYAYFNHAGHGNVVFTNTTGTLASNGAVAQLFLAPYIRFAVTNQHATIAGTVRLRAALHY